MVGFVAPPQTPALRKSTHSSVNTAILAAALASPLPAHAVDQQFESWGPGELIAVFLPVSFVIALRLEWEADQPPVDDVTGVGVLDLPNDFDSQGRRTYYRFGDLEEYNDKNLEQRKGN